MKKAFTLLGFLALASPAYAIPITFEGKVQTSSFASIPVDSDASWTLEYNPASSLGMFTNLTLAGTLLDTSRELYFEHDRNDFSIDGSIVTGPWGNSLFNLVAQRPFYFYWSGQWTTGRGGVADGTLMFCNTFADGRCGSPAGQVTMQATSGHRRVPDNSSTALLMAIGLGMLIAVKRYGLSSNA